MKNLALTGAAVIAVLLVTLSTRLIFPALEIVYYYILKTFEPEEPQLTAVPLPVAVTESAPTKKPRPARRRRPSAKTLAKAAEALA